MMNVYDLPTTIDCGGQVLHIRNNGDWRMVIDVNIALTDPELDEQERIMAAMTIFYAEPIEEIKDPQAAATAMGEFIAAGQDGNGHSNRKLIDWEEDALLIISGVNGVLGREIRAESYMHWWTFVAAYMGIGESALATVVSIRDKIAKGKKLEKYEKEFKRDNPQYFRPNKRQSKADYEELLELIGE